MPNKPLARKKNRIASRKRRKDTQDLEVTVLKELIKAKPGYMSGSDLALRLGISKVSVWGRLQKLQKDGIKIKAQRNRGYSLSKEPNKIHGELLTAYLPDLWRDSVFYEEKMESTNQLASRKLALGENTPFIVTANQQSKGKGRMGSEWSSKDFRNLYLSFAFRPAARIKVLEPFTLIVGAAVCEFIREKTQLKAMVKWPNDIYIGDKKVAGMLTESRLESEKVIDLVFGLGLNINGRITLMSNELREKASSLSNELGYNLPINQFSAELVQRVYACYQMCLKGHLTLKSFDWSEYDFLAGKEIQVKTGNGRIAGFCKGINHQGELLLQDSFGKMIRCRSGEVSISRAQL
jgi:BirA family biotin operon repressor/biotin-[acetyl-CoA-carboxylase] ligase